ncbi:MAG: hypothetical protein ACI3YH_00270 [Eubacteriales bacterium]
MIRKTKRNVCIVKWTAFALTMLFGGLFLLAASWHFNYGLSPWYMALPTLLYIFFGVAWCELIEIYDESFGEGARG